MKRGLVFAVVGLLAVLAAVVVWDRKAGKLGLFGSGRSGDETTASGSAEGGSPGDGTHTDGDAAGDPKADSSSEPLATDPASGNDRPSDPAPDPEPVFLPIELVVAGRVVDGDGDSVPGAAIQMNAPGVEAELEARSDADGRFEVSFVYDPSSGDAVVDLHFEHRSFAPLDRRIELPSGELSIKLKRLATVTIRVVDAAGDPVPSASVSIRGDSRTRLTSSGGLVTFDRLVPDVPVRVSVTHRCYADIEAELDAGESGATTTRAVNLGERKEPGPVTVRVVGHDGRAVEGASVQVSRDEQSTLTSFHKTGGDGTVSFREPGPVFSLRVTASGGVPYRRSGIHSDTVPEILEVELYPTELELLAQIVDTDGRTIGGLTAFARRSDGVGEPLIATTDWNGIARFAGGLENTSYDILMGTTGAPGGYFASGADDRVPDPAGHQEIVPHPTASVRMMLLAPGSIAGRVGGVSPDGAASVRLACYPARLGERAFFTLDARVDASGAFSVSGLPSGFYRIWIPGVEGGGSEIEPLRNERLSASKALTDVTLELR